MSKPKKKSSKKKEKQLTQKWPILKLQFREKGPYSDEINFCYKAKLYFTILTSFLLSDLFVFLDEEEAASDINNKGMSTCARMYSGGAKFHLF